MAFCHKAMLKMAAAWQGEFLFKLFKIFLHGITILLDAELNKTREESSECLISQ